jgi:methylenetetrahydrofolate reductase (NADPH)
MFFDVQVFLTFVDDCRTKWGITCPIVPGLMCINAYPGFIKMSKFCKTRVPVELAQQMEALKDDENSGAAVKQFGMEFGASVCQTLLDHNNGNTVQVLHFYTLNLEKVVYGILDILGYRNKEDGSLLLANANEMDASSQVAVGSAWARVGDRVKSIYGEAMVTEIRPNGTTVVEMNKWIMAGGQKPIAYLQKDSFDKC